MCMYVWVCVYVCMCVCVLNEFVTNKPSIQTPDDVEVKDQMDLGIQEFLHPDEPLTETLGLGER